MKLVTVGPRAAALLLLLVACDRREADGDDTAGLDTEVVDTDSDVDTEVVDTVVDTEVVDTEPPIDTELDTDGGGQLPTCAAYCATVTATCSDANANYPDERTCLDLCTLSGLAVGRASDTSGNTVGCRAHFAELARTGDAAAKADACLGARFLGGGKCGDPVENFCAIDLFVCDGPQPPYLDLQACVDAGAAWARGPEADPNGNSLACRSAQLTLAMLVSEASYCNNTRDDSPVCADDP